MSASSRNTMAENYEIVKHEPDYRHPALSLVEGQATQKLYLYELHRVLLPFLAKYDINPRRNWRELAQVTPQMMLDYWQEINNRPLAKSTKNFHLNFARRYFKQAQVAGIIPLNPAIVLRNFRREKAMAPREIPLEVIKRLLEKYKADKSLRGLRNYTMFRLVATYGLRRAEVCDIKTQDVTDQWIRVWGKGGKKRDLAMQPNIKSCIDQWLKASGTTDGFLFRHISNVTGIAEEQIQPDTFYRIMRQKMQQVDASGFSPHGLRHTAITEALRHGIPIRDVQYDVGHESLSTTEGYDASRFEVRTQMPSVMDKLLEQQEQEKEQA